MVDYPTLKQVPNVDLMNAIRNDASASYVQRIPQATQSNIKAVVDNLYQNRPQLNEFVDTLVNRIGLVIGQGLSWSNPLSMFKSGSMSFGDTVEEYQVGLLQAHYYDTDTEKLQQDVWGQELPETRSIYHKVDRQNYYKITINDALLRRAFLESGGLNQFIVQLMNAPITSDNVDEFLTTMKLIPEYNRNGGFFNVHIPDVANPLSTPDDAKFVLRKLREFAGLLPFVSTKYNAAKMPVFARPEDLILITTPQFQSALDVQALAAAFNLDLANFSQRTVLVPPEQMGITGVQAILTTRDFFRIWDTQMYNTSIQNPAGLYNNYFFHHWQIISTSLFVPAIAFTTGAGSYDPALTVYIPTDVTFTLDPVNGVVPTNLYAGNIYHFTPVVTTTPAGGNLGPVWSVSGNTSKNTFITQSGVLHVGRDEKASSLTVKADVQYYNPDTPMADGPNATLSENVLSQTISWPIVGVINSVTANGKTVTITDPSVLTGYSMTGVVTDPVAKNVVVTTLGSADVSVAVDTSGKKINVTVDGGAGAPKTYVISYTL